MCVQRTKACSWLERAHHETIPGLNPPHLRVAPKRVSGAKNAGRMEKRLKKKITKDMFPFSTTSRWTNVVRLARASSKGFRPTRYSNLGTLRG